MERYKTMILNEDVSSMASTASSSSSQSSSSDKLAANNNTNSNKMSTLGSASNVMQSKMTFENRFDDRHKYSSQMDALHLPNVNGDDFDDLEEPENVLASRQAQFSTSCQQQQQQQKQQQHNVATTSGLTGKHRNDSFSSLVDVTCASNEEQSSCSNLDGSNLNLDEERAYLLQASLNRKRSTFPFGRCKVCNDKATGVHYGISTCEGCKGFFKRSILRNEFYKCFFGNNCVLNPKNRNRCKACRFKKCIQAGMSFSGIKMGRIPKAEKVKAIETLQKNLTDPNDINDEDIELLKEAETSYSKRFEKRKELDKNLKILAENVLKMSSSSSSTNDTDKAQSHRALVSNKKHNTDHKQTNPNIQKGDENHNDDDDDNDDEDDASPSETKIKTEYQQHGLLKENEDYMTKFLEILFDQHKQQEVKNHKPQSEGSSTSNSSLSSQTSSSASSPSQDVLSPSPVANRETSIIIKNLMSLHKPLRCTSNQFIVPKTNYCNLFMNTFLMFDSNYFLISSLINDKIYQLYNEHTRHIGQFYERARYLIQNNIRVYDGHDMELEKVWNSLVESIPEFVKLVIKFSKQVPGLNEINESDFATIINNKLFDFFIITNSSLFIDGESYLYLPNNIQYSRSWMNKIKGVDVTDKLFAFVEDFNSLYFSNKEKALFITLLFTMPDVELTDPEALKDLNEFFTRSLLYEFDVSKRDYSFMNRFKHVLIKLKENRVLQAAE